MTYSAQRPAYRKGFTLIELLIVISIIAVLAGIGLGVARIARDKADDLTANQAISELNTASEGYYDQYNFLPLGEGEEIDTLRRSDQELMNILVGLDVAQDQNQNLTKFFTGQRARGNNVNKAYKGLFQTQSEAVLYGPWRKKDEDEKLYRIVYDYDYDQEIQETENVGNEIIYGRRQLIYHLGKDGESGGERNTDNIYSYKQR